MPRPSPHLDVFLVPSELRDLPVQSELVEALERLGVAAGRGAGPRSAEVLEGGYRSVRVDRPPAPTLYANRQGGFRVQCPESGESVVPAFGRALTAWREGADPTLRSCPACGRDHAFDALVTSPPAAVGAGAVVLVGAGSVRLGEQSRDELRAVLGDFHVVGSRR